MDIAAKAAAYAAYNQPNYASYSSYTGHDESYSSGYSSVSGQDYDDSYSYAATDYGYRGHGMEAPPTHHMAAPTPQSNYEPLHPPGTATVERPPLLVGLINTDFFYYNSIQYLLLHYTDFLWNFYNWHFFPNSLMM